MKGGHKMQYIILLILGIIAIVISFLTKNPAETPKETIHANGVVKKVIYSDTGNVRYYVNINTSEGNLLEAQSIYYSKTDRKYHVDDPIPVNYYFTDKGKVRCEVDDPDLIPCKTSFASLSRVMMIAGVALILLFIVFFAKSFL